MKRHSSYLPPARNTTWYQFNHLLVRRSYVELFLRQLGLKPLCIRYRKEPVAHSRNGRAARLTLGYPMTFEYLGEALQSFKRRRVLCDLVRYRKRCRDNLVSCLESFLDVSF